MGKRKSTRCNGVTPAPMASVRPRPTKKRLCFTREASFTMVGPSAGGEDNPTEPKGAHSKVTQPAHHTSIASKIPIQATHRCLRQRAALRSANPTREDHWVRLY